MRQTQRSKIGKSTACVVCDDASDGLHFGKPSCRACAAFFRRTVSHKLQYTCRRDGKCEVGKGGRTMCRLCRFNKCLDQGMLPSAVQNVPGGMAANRSANVQPQFVPLPTGFSPQMPMAGSPEFQPEYKHLSRMLEGYHKFLSLKRAGCAMIMNDGVSLLAYEVGQKPSHFDIYQKVVKIGGSLMFDMLEASFLPFKQLPIEDKRKMFTPFFHMFCNCARSFRTYLLYEPGDDRLVMPDDGYVKLSEMHLFFKDSKKITSHPEEVARIFHNSIQYLITNVVSHMRNANLQEAELVVLFGMFCWADATELSAETQQLSHLVRNEIILDLHKYYRGLGINEEEITLKTANLFLLIPKLENAVKMMLEDASISAIFNVIEDVCKGQILV